MDDAETTRLLESARAGSSEALEELFERYGERLLAIVRLRMGRSLRSQMESRDILQASLLKALSRFDQFAGDGGSSLMAWLARVAENEIRDRADYLGRQRRDAAREVALGSRDRQVADRIRSASSRLVLSEQLQRLERVLEELPEDYREVVVLRRLEELTWTQVGQRLGRSPDACRMLLSRALAALTVGVAADESAAGRRR